MDYNRVRKNSNSSGIALFMVIAAITVLALMVTEFTYVAQVNQKIAYDKIDQLKAFYLSKSALKISLLRLKAYSNVKGLGKTAGVSLPKQMIDQIWSFPLMFPLPVEAMGATGSEKDAMTSFNKDSGLEGKFTAVIESESAKYNLNLLLPYFVPAPSSTPSPSPSPSPTPTSSSSQSDTPFDPEEARKGLAELLAGILQNKFKSDEDFAAEYRDFRLEDLISNISSWVDMTYDNPSVWKSSINPKKAPFYSLTELHMIPPMDDKLYALFAPQLTASATPGINVNTMKEYSLRMLVPRISDEEVTAFFKYRDSQEQDNLFKTTDEFFTYLKTNISSIGSSDESLKIYQDDLKKRNLRVVVDETEFKITIQAKVNQATKVIEAWVTLGSTTSGSGASGGSGTQDTVPANDPGLKITFMRIL